MVEERLRLLVAMPQKQWIGPGRIVCTVCQCAFEVMNSKEGLGLFLSVVIVVGQPLCSESVNIQGKGRQWECVRLYDKQAARGRESLS